MKIGFFSLLFLILLVLKLTGEITTSWFWVTAPIWAPFPVIFIGSIVLSLLFVAVVTTWQKIGELLWGR